MIIKKKFIFDKYLCIKNLNSESNFKNINSLNLNCQIREIKTFNFKSRSLSLLNKKSESIRKILSMNISIFEKVK